MPHMAIEPMSVGNLRPYAKNARTHSKKQIKQIARSIERFGFTNPVLISNENEIIAGHGRVEAAKLLGVESVPTLRLSHLTEAQRRAYVIADNKLAQNAGWDRDVLAIELQALIDVEFDIELTGFSLAEVDILLDEFAFKVGTAPHTNTFGLGDTGRYRTNVWDYAGINTFRAERDEELSMHPTVKPVALVTDAIKDCSKRGEIVLDPCAGSGTTLIAAEKTGRRARLIEFDPAYCDQIVHRFEKLTGKQARLAATGDAFEDTADVRRANILSINKEEVQ